MSSWPHRLRLGSPPAESPPHPNAEESNPWRPSSQLVAALYIPVQEVPDSPLQAAAAPQPFQALPQSVFSKKLVQGEQPAPAVVARRPQRRQRLPKPRLPAQSPEAPASPPEEDERAWTADEAMCSVPLAELGGRGAAALLLRAGDRHTVRTRLSGSSPVRRAANPFDRTHGSPLRGGVAADAAEEGDEAEAAAESGFGLRGATARASLRMAPSETARAAAAAVLRERVAMPPKPALPPLPSLQEDAARAARGSRGAFRLSVRRTRPVRSSLLALLASAEAASLRAEAAGAESAMGMALLLTAKEAEPEQQPSPQAEGPPALPQPLAKEPRATPARVVRFDDDTASLASPEQSVAMPVLRAAPPGRVQGSILVGSTRAGAVPPPPRLHSRAVAALLRESLSPPGSRQSELYVRQGLPQAPGRRASGGAYAGKGKKVPQRSPAARRWRNAAAAIIKAIRRVRSMAGGKRESVTPSAVVDSIRLAAMASHAVTEVHEQSGVAYLQQGDEVFYSEVMVRRRLELVNDPDIRVAVALWWNVMPKSYRVLDPFTPSGQQQLVEKAEYVVMNVKIQRALATDPFDFLSALQSAEEDWIDDCHGKDALDEAAFRSALFQLADIWVDSVEPCDYVQFLQCLLWRVAQCPPWPPATWREDSLIVPLDLEGGEIEAFVLPSARKLRGKDKSWMGALAGSRAGSRAQTAAAAAAKQTRDLLGGSTGRLARAGLGHDGAFSAAAGRAASVSAAHVAGSLWGSLADHDAVRAAVANSGLGLLRQLTDRIAKSD